MLDGRGASTKRDSSLITGTAEDVVTEENLKEAYGVDVRIIRENTRDCALLKSCVPVLLQ